MILVLILCIGNSHITNKLSLLRLLIQFILIWVSLRARLIWRIILLPSLPLIGYLNWIDNVLLGLVFGLEDVFANAIHYLLHLVELGDTATLRHGLHQFLLVLL